MYVECYPDEVLVKTLTGISSKNIKHSGNKSGVFTKLEKTTGKIGLVDQDPGAAMPRKAANIVWLARPHNIITGDFRSNTVIVLCPRLEDWIIRICSLYKINPLEFGLPASGRELHKVINGNVDKFGNLLGALLSGKSTELLHLAALLNNKV